MNTGVWKNSIIVASLLAILPALAFSAQAQTIKMSKSYKTIPVQIIKKINLPKGYHEGLFYDDKSMWVANGMNGKIWVVDLSTGAVVSEIEPIAGFTEGITKAPGGGYFVTDWTEKKVYYSKIENNKMTAEYMASVAPAYPAGIVWTGQRLFIITWTRGMGTKFDILEMDEHLKLLNKIRIKRIQEPAHLTWDGKDLWITSWFSRLIYKIDVNKWEITGSFKSPVKKTTGIVWDGSYLWLTGTTADLYKVEVKNDN